MKKIQVENYFKSFTYVLLNELLATLDSIDESLYKDKMAGELLEIYIKTLTAGLKFLQNMSTENKINFIKAAEAIIDAIEDK